jgi:hypothetical protein
MALLAKSGTPSLASLYPTGGQVIPGLKAATGGILAGDVCYIASDGTATKSDGTAATAPAVGFGIAAGDAAAGEAVTLYRGVIFHYGSGLTPGAAVLRCRDCGATRYSRDHRRHRRRGPRH